MSAADEFPKHPADNRLRDMRGFSISELAAHREPSPHKSLDPVTGNCADCGATREEIDDALAPTCHEHSGPHAEALRALFRTIARKEAEIVQLARNLESYELATVDISRHLRAAKAHLRELQASFEKLKAVG